jgi:hypothetical protein
MVRGAGRGVLALALLVQGCAGIVPDRRATPELVGHPGGAFLVQRGQAGIVIGAPHGTSDSDTDRVALDLARRTGFGLVVATGFAFLDPEGRRLNVNRPTESVPGSPARQEAETRAARDAYAAYRRHLHEAAQGPLALYVEIHGNGRRQSAGRLEIATVGVSRDEGWRLKTLLELVRDAHLGARPGPPRLDVLVEPVDPLHYRASAAKRGGALGLAPRALHIEIPRIARTAHREAYTALLADFLTQAAGVLLAAPD